MKPKTLMSRVASCLLAVTMAFSLIGTMVIGVHAENVSQEVLDVRNSVVRLEVTNLIFEDNQGNQYPDMVVSVSDDGYYNILDVGTPLTMIGTGFLIGTDDSNLTTILTASHMITAEEIEVVIGYDDDGSLAYATGSFVPSSYSVIIGRDYKVECEVKGNSSESEFAILVLKDEQKFANRTGATLHIGSNLGTGTSVHALGFPSDVADSALQSEYEPSDVIITSGNINKYGNEAVQYSDNDSGSYSLPCYTHSATISGGNSGGPLVDDNGNVIGINIASKTSGSTTRYYSVDISLAATVLDSLGIEYKSDADTTATVSSDTSTDADATTDAAVTVTEPEESSVNFILIACIAGGVVIVALVVVLVIVLVKKKKPTAPTPAPGTTYTNQPPYTPIPQNPPSPAPTAAPYYTNTPAPAPSASPANETSVLRQNAGETTVLNQGTGETTVLSAQSVSGGTLLRTGNGERIPIRLAEFSIGRERNSVDYCIDGNTNVSRIHARIKVHNGEAYIVDNKAVNGTYVNGVKLRPGQEMKLSDGDKISIADEQFEYRK